MEKPYILSIDIGIKNFSYCFFQKYQKTYDIIKWDVLNLMETIENKNIKPTEQKICTEKNKKGSCCNKKAIYSKNNCYYCLKHSTSSNYIIPCSELKKSAIQKMNLSQLKEVINKYGILNNNNENKKETKKEIVSHIFNFIDKHMLEKITSPQKIKCKDCDLITLGKNMNSYFDDLFTPYIGNISTVCIELQMTSKMRILSFMVMEYFLIHKVEVKMMNPCFKLKNLEVEKTDYSSRKKNAVKHCLAMLIENKKKEVDKIKYWEQWIEFFEKNKKKDDLSDCFLQGIYFLF